ncbi:hypothetical protein Y032_0153g2934 [Ancylostoma ceylanicum]|uniref:Uncharacterized protein n=1 Tax=Ancylostoma ceylanicum TaxID=53326 RepID=A0A016T0Q6_9BILA|nr:hypothetical protein Y032_0153g2934 [Ancylostoma ceylanicum]
MAFICPTLAQKTCLFLLSAARTFKSCSRDALMNRPITVQQPENVYMYEAPPPYAGIGQAPPVPAGNLQLAGKLAPTAPPPAYS